MEIFRFYWFSFCFFFLSFRSISRFEILLFVVVTPFFPSLGRSLALLSLSLSSLSVPLSQHHLHLFRKSLSFQWSFLGFVPIASRVIAVLDSGPQPLARQEGGKGYAPSNPKQKNAQMILRGAKDCESLRRRFFSYSPLLLRRGFM